MEIFITRSGILLNWDELTINGKLLNFFIKDTHLYFRYDSTFWAQLVVYLQSCKLWVRSSPGTNICVMNIDVCSVSGCCEVLFVYWCLKWGMKGKITLKFSSIFVTQVNELYKDSVSKKVLSKFTRSIAFFQLTSAKKAAETEIGAQRGAPIRTIWLRIYPTQRLIDR